MDKSIDFVRCSCDACIGRAASALGTASHERGFPLWGLALASALAIVLALAWPLVARAQEKWLLLSGAAMHLDGRSHCNDLTAGVGLERSGAAAGEAAGVYLNSNCRWSAYAATSWTPLASKVGAARVAAGAIAGAVTGYGRPLTPVAGFAIALEGGQDGVNLLYVPPFRGSGNVVWLNYKVRLK